MDAMSSDGSPLAGSSGGDSTAGSAGAGLTGKDEKERPFTDPTLGKVGLNEEAKPKPKYPVHMAPGRPGFILERLNKRQKYFDSGDYNMAIAKGLTRVEWPKATGGLIPTADSLPPRRASLAKSKLATESS
ncbi:alpha-endosulfine-like [Rhipicephalus microplus]|uniref:alpha-endosulfine-like n=1 Tax=Rhipicephalus microplus TaxID=6941 RepID=UPI003F6B1814